MWGNGGGNCIDIVAIARACLRQCLVDFKESLKGLSMPVHNLAVPLRTLNSDKQANTCSLTHV